MNQKMRRFLRDESGATAIEYGLIAGLISIVIITVLTSVGTKLNVKIPENLDGAELTKRQPIRWAAPRHAILPPGGFDPITREDEAF